MKIIFDQYEFEVSSVSYQLDESGRPVDIIICASEDTLNCIANFAMIGANIQESYRNPNASHEGLFARLLDFTVQANEVHYL